jgi:predicted metalloprotease with PDZ domain
LTFLFFFFFQVNNGSPAEAAGLRAGDAVVRVNSTDMFNLRHKDAQDVIVRAGNNFEVTVQRYFPPLPLSPSTPSTPPTQPLLRKFTFRAITTLSFSRDYSGESS